MLNCSAGAECILHENNRHPQNSHNVQHHAGSEEQLEVVPYEIADVDAIQGLLNDTDSELSSLSHLDAPNESLYMMCGVLIAMLLVALIIVLLAVTISKLRKRGDSESHHPSTTAAAVLAPVSVVGASPSSSSLPTCEPPLSSLYQPPSLWHYPAAHFLYATEQDVSITPLPMERPGFCRGVRKNLGGRWKRLVKRKSLSDASAVSRDHLKQIFVY